MNFTMKWVGDQVTVFPQAASPTNPHMSEGSIEKTRL